MQIWVVYSILGFPKDCNILEATKSYKLEAWPLTTATAATITTTTATTIVTAAAANIFQGWMLAHTRSLANAYQELLI